MVAEAGFDGPAVADDQAAAVQLLALLATHAGLLALTLAARGELGDTSFERLRGLGRRNPWLAGFLILLLASAVGLPPTLGFAGKLEVLLAGLRAGLLVASGLALLSLALAAWLVLPLASSLEKARVLRPPGRFEMKASMSTCSTRRPSSARIFTRSGVETTHSRPSPGTCG